MAIKRPIRVQKRGREFRLDLGPRKGAGVLERRRAVNSCQRKTAVACEYKPFSRLRKFIRQTMS